MYTNMYNGETCGDKVSNSSTTTTADKVASAQWNDEVIYINSAAYAALIGVQEIQGYASCSDGIRTEISSCEQVTGYLAIKSCPLGSPVGCYRCIQSTKNDLTC